MSRHIDAEKLERFFKRDEWGTPDERWRPESEFGRFVDAVPTEDVVPVIHAKWVEREISIGNIWGVVNFACSHCQHRVPDKTNYCPECGAKMDLGEDELIAPSIIAEGEDDG